MAKIKNNSARPYYLPTRTFHAESFGEREHIDPGTTLEVPDWYVDALRDEREWKRRLQATGPDTWEITGGRLGQIDAVAAARNRVQEAHEKARISDQARSVAEADRIRAEQERDTAKRRAEELERELAALRRGRDAEDELEAALAKRAQDEAAKRAQQDDSRARTEVETTKTKHHKG